MNLLGFDIYWRPAPHEDGSPAPLVFLDDVSKPQMALVALKGLPLAAAIESSLGRFRWTCGSLDYICICKEMRWSPMIPMMRRQR
jgi:hypothetical protein